MSEPGIEIEFTARASISPRWSVHELLEARFAAVALVEARQPRNPLLVARGDAVEVVLHAGGELRIHEARVVLLERLRDREGGERRHERRSLLEHVTAVEDRAHDRGVRRRPADAAVLERLHEARLGVAGGRASLVTVRAELGGLERLANGELRQSALLGLVGGLVLAGLIRGAGNPGT